MNALSKRKKPEVKESSVGAGMPSKANDTRKGTHGEAAPQNPQQEAIDAQAVEDDIRSTLQKKAQEGLGSGKPNIKGRVMAIHSRAYPDGAGGIVEANRICIAGSIRSGELNELTMTKKTISKLGIGLGDSVVVSIEKG